MYTGEQLAQWAEKALAMQARYWYGTCWYRATEDLRKRKAKQYPAHYGTARTAVYRQHIAQGRMVCDCVGLIKGFFWTGNGGHGQKYASGNCPDVSADGMLRLCAVTGNLRALPEKRGLVLWRKGHIGVYVGGGWAIEARGFAYGVVRTRVAERGWQKWGQLPMLDYGPGQAENPPEEPEPLLRQGAKGDAVRRMQGLLLRWNAQALARYGADGEFGGETRKWVLRFQKQAGIECDGIVGPITWRKLKGE